MSRIHIQYPIECDQEESKAIVADLLAALEEKYSVSHEHLDDGSCTLSGAGINGTLNVHDDEIEIQAKLGFLMAPFKAVIESEITRKLDEKFDA